MSPILLLLSACTPPAPAPVLPARIQLMAGPGGTRLHHEVTGPTWADEHTAVGDTVWELGPEPSIDAQGRLHGASQDQVAAFVAGSPLRVVVDLTGQVDQPGTLSLRATARWEHAPEDVLDLGQTSLSLDAGQAPGTVQLDTIPLPQQVGVLDLELTTSFSAAQPVFATQTHHRLPLSWAAPLPDTPLYHRTVTWASTWAAGLPAQAALSEEERPAVEDEIARRLLAGVYSLGEQGHSYGAFKRPKVKDNQAHVALDHPRAACGEYRGLLLALLEYHGVDGQWVMMSFRSPSPDRLSMYETREIAAVGTEPKVWQHWNHVAVDVNGQIYDPTYGLHAPDFATYEDDLFARYCTGEETRCKTPGGWCQQPRPEGSCEPNPPGFDPDDPRMGMKVWRGDDY